MQQHPLRSLNLAHSRTSISDPRRSLIFIAVALALLRCGHTNAPRVSLVLTEAHLWETASFLLFLSRVGKFIEHRVSLAGEFRIAVQRKGFTIVSLLSPCGNHNLELTSGSAIRLQLNEPLSATADARQTPSVCGSFRTSPIATTAPLRNRLNLDRRIHEN